jgi:ATP-dependent DNA helicase RecG
LTNNYVSTPRNRQIAKIVKEMGWIEKFGTGIMRVCNMFVDYGLKQPLFEIIPGGFAATVFAHNNDTFENVTENVTENITENVTENRLQSLLKQIEENNKISTQRLAHALGVTRMTVARDIEYLKGKEILERIGPDKVGYWKIIK